METKPNAFASMLPLEKPYAQKDATMERTGRRFGGEQKGKKHKQNEGKMIWV